MKWPETWLFRRAVYINMYYWKIYNYTSRTNYHSIEYIQVWILLGYPSNILGYPINTGNYTSKKKLGRFPTIPRPPPVSNFFNIHLKKNIIQYKSCRIRFYSGLYTCPMNNKREIYKFGFLNFWFFDFQN